MAENEVTGMKLKAVLDSLNESDAQFDNMDVIDLMIRIAERGFILIPKPQYTDEQTEWAIEAPGRGYISGLHNGCMADTRHLHSLESRSQAGQYLGMTKSRYVDMGCPEVAKTLRIVERTATLTKSEWKPV